MSNTTLIPHVTDADVADAIAPGSGLVAIKFTAAWCGPCRMMAPAVESIAREYEGALRVVELDADANPATLARYNVRGLPTILLFRDGELADRIIGAVPATALRDRVARQLAATG